MIKIAVRFLIIIFVFVPMWLSSTVSAEDVTPRPLQKGLYLCDGIWTTNACDAPESVLPYRESSGDSHSPERVRKKKIEEILHPVRIKASDIRNTYYARYDISYVENLCTDLVTSIADCVDAAMAEHEKLLNYEIKLREQELKKMELSQQKQKVETEITIQNIHPQPVYIGPGIIPPRPRPPSITPPGNRPSHGHHLIPRPNPGQSLSIPGVRRN